MVPVKVVSKSNTLERRKKCFEIVTDTAARQETEVEGEVTSKKRGGPGLRQKSNPLFTSPILLRSPLCLRPSIPLSSRQLRRYFHYIPCPTNHVPTA